MIVKSLPDISNYSLRTPAFNNNIVVFAQTKERYFYPEHFTSFLFLTNFVNKGDYSFNRKKVSLSDKTFLLSKPDDTLEIKFDNALPLDTLIILFDEQFFLDTYRFYQKSDSELLESPIIDVNNFPSFPDLPFESSTQVRDVLMKMINNSASQEILDEQLVELIGILTRQMRTAVTQLSKLQAVKKSTRHELYRRLHSAREFMDDHSTTNLNIEQIAQQACLNKFHFITTFKSLFNVTPNQYLMNVRLEKAYHLLKDQDMTVTQACRTVGYESVGSFSNAFTRRFNISPSLLKL